MMNLDMRNVADTADANLIEILLPTMYATIQLVVFPLLLAMWAVYIVLRFLLRKPSPGLLKFNLIASVVAVILALASGIPIAIALRQ